MRAEDWNCLTALILYLSWNINEQPTADGVFEASRNKLIIIGSFKLVGHHVGNIEWKCRLYTWRSKLQIKKKKRTDKGSAHFDNTLRP